MNVADSDLRALTVFRAVVEHRSFLGAQVALGLSQSAVSFHMKALEERLGFSLCRRGRGGFELTERGEIVYERSKLLSQSLADFESAVSRLRNRVSGSMRLGIVDNTISDEQLPIPSIIGTIRRKAPDAAIHLNVDAPEVLLAELAGGGLDIAILPETRPYAGLRFTPLREERHGLYCSNSHPLFTRPDHDITVGELAHHQYVVRAYASLDELSAVPGATANAKVSNMEALAILILSGAYLGFLPTHLAMRWCDRGEMRRLCPDSLALTSRFFIASRAGRRQSSVTEMFIQHLVSDISGRFYQ